METFTTATTAYYYSDTSAPTATARYSTAAIPDKQCIVPQTSGHIN